MPLKETRNLQKLYRSKMKLKWIDLNAFNFSQKVQKLTVLNYWKIRPKKPQRSSKSFCKQKGSPCISPGGKTSSSFICCVCQRPRILPTILKLYILTACPAQTIYRLFAQVICARKAQLHYFQLPLPLPQLEFATVNVRLDISIQSSAMFLLKSLTKETELEFMGIFGWFFNVNIPQDMDFIYNT